MRLSLFLWILAILSIACTSPTATGQHLAPAGNTLETRILPPAGYTRLPQSAGSFGAWLRQLPLMPAGSVVHYYTGATKADTSVHVAVIRMDVGTRDLQQCADAVMRLRSEYLYQAGRYREIHFNYLSDGKPRYFLAQSGGKTDYPAFRRYMDQVFAYANTRSLIDELHPIADIRQIVPGQVLIQRGTPYGHAMLVADVATDAAGNRIFLLAQSYMPAQEIHLVCNPTDSALSPWFLAQTGPILTPEWHFEDKDLYGW